jgi:hypothetical protein
MVLDVYVVFLSVGQSYCRNYHSVRPSPLALRYLEYELLSNPQYLNTNVAFAWKQGLRARYSLKPCQLTLTMTEGKDSL